MSYSIVYNKQFLKIDDKIIPLVLYGSNNCYEPLPNGRQRREALLEIWENAKGII